MNKIQYLNIKSIETVNNNNKIKIEDLFDNNKDEYEVNINPITKHEYLFLNNNIKVLNKVDEKITYTPIKKVIRHKVNKNKWLISTKNNKVFVTGDHSIMIYRDDKIIETKAKDIKKITDKLIEINDDLTYKIANIKECKIIGTFDDEYVYDIEVKDKTHTFIANNILVHNSNYLTINELYTKQEGFKGNIIEFVQLIYKHRLVKLIDIFLNNYAKKFNTVNFQNFELESISRNGIWRAKKKYALNINWQDGVTFNDLENIKTTGFEQNQSSIPKFCRLKLDEVLYFILSKENFTEADYSELMSMLKNIKREFELINIENVSMIRRVGDYEKYILDDKKEFKIAPRCPIHIRAAGYHNFLINNNKLNDKYNLIKTGDRVSYFYTDDTTCNVFGFIPGSYPIELGTNIDYTQQFNNTIIEPINLSLQAMKIQLLNPQLMYMPSTLF